MENKKIVSSKLTLLIIAVLGIIVYHQVIFFHFINWDDNFYVINNPYIKAITLSNIAYLFSHYYYHGVYEPLQLLSYMLIYHINGLQPLWFHIFNASLFLFDAMLVYVLVKELTTPFTAAIAAILFLLAPVNADSAAWVSELKNTQSLFFVLISILSYIAFIKHNKTSYYTVSILFFIFALLTKQTVATMAAILFLLEWYMYNRSVSKTFFVQIPFYVLALVAALVFVMGQLNLHASNPAQLGNAFQHFLAVLVNVAGIFSYPAKIIFPFNLICFYTTDIFSSILTTKVILSITALIVFTCLLIVSYKKHHKGFFWMSWYFINMLPAYGIVVVPFYTNWYLLVPSIGVYTLIGMGIERIYNTANLRKLSIAVVSIIIVLFGILDYQRVGAWKDDAHLWKDAIKKTPHYYFGYEMYARALAQQGDYEGAKQYADKSLELNPYNTKILSIFAFFSLQGGNYSKALSYIQKLLKYEPNNVDYMHMLALYYKGVNDSANYAQELKKCALLDPYMIPYVNELAEYYVNNGETDKALSLVKQIIAQHPDNAIFYRLLGAYYLKYTNDTYDAKKAFEKSLLLDPRQQGADQLTQFIQKLPG
jgi:Flp pilus assembly protein TadD